MTPEERAKLIIKKGGWHHPTGVDCDRLEERIAAAICEAVKAEREACAKIAASHFDYRHDAELTLAGNLIANAIRERPL